MVVVDGGHVGPSGRVEAGDGYNTMETKKGQYGQPVRIPPSLLAEVDTLASELTLIPGEKPSRKATLRHVLTVGIEAVKARRGVQHGRL